LVLKSAYVIGAIVKVLIAGIIDDKVNDIFSRKFCDALAVNDV
jgi:hypothetical protein